MSQDTFSPIPQWEIEERMREMVARTERARRDPAWAASQGMSGGDAMDNGRPAGGPGGGADMVYSGWQHSPGALANGYAWMINGPVTRAEAARGDYRNGQMAATAQYPNGVRWRPGTPLPESRDWTAGMAPWQTNAFRTQFERHARAGYRTPGLQGWVPGVGDMPPGYNGTQYSPYGGPVGTPPPPIAPNPLGNQSGSPHYTGGPVGHVPVPGAWNPDGTRNPEGGRAPANPGPPPGADRVADTIQAFRLMLGRGE